MAGKDPEKGVEKSRREQATEKQEPVPDLAPSTDVSSGAPSGFDPAAKGDPTADQPDFDAPPPVGSQDPTTTVDAIGDAAAQFGDPRDFAGLNEETEDVAIEDPLNPSKIAPDEADVVGSGAVSMMTDPLSDPFGLDTEVDPTRGANLQTGFDPAAETRDLTELRDILSSDEFQAVFKHRVNEGEGGLMGGFDPVWDSIRFGAGDEAPGTGDGTAAAGTGDTYEKVFSSDPMEGVDDGTLGSWFVKGLADLFLTRPGTGGRESIGFDRKTGEAVDLDKVGKDTTVTSDQSSLNAEFHNVGEQTGVNRGLHGSYAADKKAADEKAAADKKAADEKAAADKKAADEKAAADKKAADEKAADEKAADDDKAADEKAADDKNAADEKADDGSQPVPDDVVLTPAQEEQRQQMLDKLGYRRSNPRSGNVDPTETDTEAGGGQIVYDLTNPTGVEPAGEGSNAGEAPIGQPGAIDPSEEDDVGVATGKEEAVPGEGDLYDDGQTLTFPGEGLDESDPFYEKAQEESEALRDSMLDEEMIPEAEESMLDDAPVD